MLCSHLRRRLRVALCDDDIQDVFPAAAPIKSIVFAGYVLPSRVSASTAANDGASQPDSGLSGLPMQFMGKCACVCVYLPACVPACVCGTLAQEGFARSLEAPHRSPLIYCCAASA